jgi:hypothetical protein
VVLSVHVPLLQLPQAPHALLQQTLPTQKLDWHWPAVEQAEPIGSSPQELLVQLKPEAQLLFPVQVVGQAGLEPLQR